MTSAPRLGTPGALQLRAQLTERDWQVLRDVDRFRLVSGRHLQMLHVGQGEGRRPRRGPAITTTHQVQRLLARSPAMWRRPGGQRRLRLHAGPSRPVGCCTGIPADAPRPHGNGFLIHTLAIAG